MKSISLTGRPLATLNEPFTAVTGFVELPGNQGVVLDAAEVRLVMVNFATGAVAPIGRRGGGPGEWQRPLTLLRGPANQAVAGDPALNKLHLIGQAGTITGAILPPRETPVGQLAPGGIMGMTIARGMDAQGRIYFQAPPPPTTRASFDSLLIVRYDPATSGMEIVGVIPSGISASIGGSPTDMKVDMRPKAMPAQDAWGALPDGRVAIVRAAPYRVDIVAGRGHVRQGQPVTYQPVRVGAAERAAYRKRLATARSSAIAVGMSGANAPRVMSRPIIPSLQDMPDDEFPRVMPPFLGQESIRVTPEGEVWVLRTRAAADSVPTYDIFSGSGLLIGKATLKPRSAVVGFGAGVVYVARQDPEDDLRYLEKYAR
jgi:hypothetical protein